MCNNNDSLNTVESENIDDISIKDIEDNSKELAITTGLSSTTLKMIAIIIMVIDHVGMVVFPEQTWMRYIGRLAFPIFAFQIAEGYRFTHNFAAYALKLLIFAFLSEIPFDLCLTNQPFYFEYQNVFFTLLLGLLLIHELDGAIHNKDWIYKIKCIGVIFVITIVTLILNSDYGIHGVLLVGSFYLFREHKIFQLISMYIIFGPLFSGNQIEIFNTEIMMNTQLFCLASLPIIWLYKGKKGIRNEAVKFFGYTFYMIHLFILWFISWLEII